MRESVSVNFKKSFPLFPLPETALLPHTIVPLSVHQASFRQLVDHALDGSGQIAVATFGTQNDAAPLVQTPNVRPAVCLAQIVQHESQNSGYNVLLYGLCRATIQKIEAPSLEFDYCKASITPTEASETEELDVEHRRVELQQLLQRPNLQRLERLEALEYWLEQEEISTPALFELIGGSLLDDPEFRYELLAEPSCEERTIRILSELRHIDMLLSKSEDQSYNRWDKGISWN
ncbi:MAG: LON peptidase substrate-binding domain-containing protein [Phycisphaerales bacterium]|nr:LON peptidase substrate-binding domain-containing protein [Phycisphaerales bacterium]